MNRPLSHARRNAEIPRSFGQGRPAARSVRGRPSAKEKGGIATLAPISLSKGAAAVLQHSKWTEDGKVKTVAKHGSPRHAVAEKAIALA